MKRLDWTILSTATRSLLATLASLATPSASSARLPRLASFAIPIAAAFTVAAVAAIVALQSGWRLDGIAGSPLGISPGIAHAGTDPSADILRAKLIERPREPVAAEPFVAVAVNGAAPGLADYAGKYVLLNFWATWCTPCKEELPAMEALYNALKDHNFVVLAVAMAETPEQVAAFLEMYPLSFPVLADADGAIADLYGVDSIPLTYLITPEGKIEARARGPREWNDPELQEYFRLQAMR